ncbi:MAG: DUF86 domain-containing protein [Desulfatitalea sp.]
MVKKDLIITKASAVKLHLSRIANKVDCTFEDFVSNIDVQESVLFNIQMAIQNCLDIAAHIISDENIGIASSNNEMFYLLEENGYIIPELTEKMVSAVGFRNLVVHEYAKIDLKQVFQIAQKDIRDLSEFLKAVLTRANIGP